MSANQHHLAGTIFIKGTVGRALRKAPAAVLAQDVLDSAGDFAPGEAVYVVMRGKDGGQNVVGTAIARCAGPALRRFLSRSKPVDADGSELPEAAVVIEQSDLRIFWQSRK